MDLPCSSYTIYPTGKLLEYRYVHQARLMLDRATNVASMSSIPATFLERIYGFWAANLMAMICLGVSVLLLVLYSPKIGPSIVLYCVY